MSRRKEPGEYETGYRKTPVASRFRKGQSGNPGGRPPGRRKELPYEAVLGQKVTLRENGAERRVSAEEAFLLQMSKQGLEGDGPAARAIITVIEEARANGLDRNGPADSMIEVAFVAPGSVNTALEPLRMAKKLDRYRETARMALEPWLVQAALDRLGDKHLTPEEQEVVVRATRTPRKVRWPEWWEMTE